MNGISGGKSYDVKFFAAIAEIEEQHFWFRLRRKVISNVLTQYLSHRRFGKYLEIGCGTGRLLRVVGSIFPNTIVFGSDSSIEAIQLAKALIQCPLLVMKAEHISVLPRFEAVGMFDVLEHVPDDDAVLKGVHAALRNEGVLLITVPAHRWLWSYADNAAKHQRRYTRRELIRKLHSAGFNVKRVSYFFATLLPLLIIGRLLARTHRACDSPYDKMMRELRISPFWNRILFHISGWELLCLKLGITLPVGSSLIAVACKQKKLAGSGPFDEVQI